MKTCPNCKASVVDSAKFCHKCRFNIKKYEEESNNDTLYCTECGAELLSDASFCSECGADVITNEVASQKDTTSSSISFESLGAISFAASEQLYAQNGLVVENGVLTGYTGKKRTVTVFGSIEEIYDGAFEGNQIITCVEIEEGIKSIGRKAFASCPSLIEVSIPKSCKILYGDVFEGDNLKILILPMYDENIIYGCISDLAKKYFDDVDIEDFCEEINGKTHVSIEKINKNAVLIKKYEEEQIAKEKRIAEEKRLNEERRKKEEEEKYQRELLETKYAIGATVKMGFYPDRSESLEWVVLDRKDDKALLITKKIIDCRKFNEYGIKDASYWSTCSLRSWLNGDFIKNSFMVLETEKIVATDLPSSTNPIYKTKDVFTVNDKIFLLSIDEVNKYFPTYEETKCTITQLAKKHGAYCDTNGYGYWWLRTTGELSTEASYIFYSGGVSTKGYDVTGTIFGVRPAMWIKIY